MNRHPNFRTVGILHFDDGTHAFVDTYGKGSLVETIIELTASPKYKTHIVSKIGKKLGWKLTYVECIDEDNKCEKRIKSISLSGRMKHFCAICNTEGE